MKIINKYSLVLALAFIFLSCTKELFYINNINIKINNVTIQEINEIKAYINQSFTFKEKDLKPKDNTNVNQKIFDWEITITSPMKIKDCEVLTRHIEKKDRSVAIILYESILTQTFQSASSSSEGELTLKINITEGAKAFYKDSRKEITLINHDKNYASFKYERKKDENYVDYFILPPGMTLVKNPSHYYRIPLYGNLEAIRLEWKSGFWEKFLDTFR